MNQSPDCFRFSLNGYNICCLLAVPYPNSRSRRASGALLAFRGREGKDPGPSGGSGSLFPKPLPRGLWRAVGVLWGQPPWGPCWGRGGLQGTRGVPGTPGPGPGPKGSGGPWEARGEPGDPRAPGASGGPPSGSMDRGPRAGGLGTGAPGAQPLWGSSGSAEGPGGPKAPLRLLVPKGPPELPRGAQGPPEGLLETSGLPRGFHGPP